MKKLTSELYWNKNWTAPRLEHKEPPFTDIFDRFFPRNKILELIEIGCVPGRFLLYFNKHFGYKVNGIDFADLRTIRKLFAENNLSEFKLYKKDFTKFKIKKRFDIVCSFGFIEHFKDYKKIFEKHVSLTKRQGLIIIEMPNFGFLQGKLHYFFDRKNLERHNTEVMDLNVLKKLCEKHDLKILYLNYHGTIDFWIDNTDHPRALVLFFSSFRLIFRLINKLINLPNKNLSPYIVLVAKNEPPH